MLEEKVKRKQPSEDEILKAARNVVQAVGSWPPGWCMSQLCPAVLMEEKSSRRHSLDIKETKVPSLCRVQIDGVWLFGSRSALQGVTSDLLRRALEMKVDNEVQALEMSEEPCLVLFIQNDTPHAFDTFSDVVLKKAQELQAEYVETSKEHETKRWEQLTESTPDFISTVRETVLSDSIVRLHLSNNMKFGLALVQKDRWFLRGDRFVFFSESEATRAWTQCQNSISSQTAVKCLRQGKLSAASAMLSGQPLVHKEINDLILRTECEARALMQISEKLDPVSVLTHQKKSTTSGNNAKSIEALMTAERIETKTETPYSKIWHDFISTAATMDARAGKAKNLTKLPRLRRLEDRLVRASGQRTLLPFAVADAILATPCTKHDQLKRVVASGCAAALSFHNTSSAANAHFAAMCNSQKQRVSRFSVLEALKMPGLAKINTHVWCMRKLHGTYQAVVNASDDAAQVLQCIQTELGIPDGELAETEKTPRIRIGLKPNQDVRLEIAAEKKSSKFQIVLKTIIARLRGSAVQCHPDEIFIIFQDSGRLLPRTVFCVSLEAEDFTFDANCVYSKPPQESVTPSIEPTVTASPRASLSIFRAHLQEKNMLEPVQRAERLIHALIKLSRSESSDLSLKRMLAADIILALLDACQLPDLCFPFAYRAMLVRAFGSTAASSPKLILTNLATQGLPALSEEEMSVLHDLACLLKCVREHMCAIEDKNSKKLIQ